MTEADVAEAGPLERADVEIGRKLAAGRDRPVVKAVAKAGKLGDQEPLYGLAVVMLAAGLLTRRPTLARAGLRMGLAVGAADLMKSGLKRVVKRTRPHVLMDEGRYESELGGADEKPEQSFPSGHMAGSMAAAASVRRLYPRSAPYAYGACALLGWSRISKGAHWPSDVAVGALTGLAAEAVTAAVAARVPGLRSGGGAHVAK